MPTKIGINQHDILHQHYPNDCCLCRSEGQYLQKVEQYTKLEAEHYTLKERLIRAEKKESEYRVALQYIVDHKWAVDIKDGEPTFTSSRQKWINEIIDVATKALKVTKGE